MTKRIRSSFIKQPQFMLINLLVVLCNSLLILEQASLLISLYCAILWLLQFAIHHHLVKPIKSWTLYLLSIAGLIILFSQALQLGLLLFMVNLLILSYHLKLFECKQQKDLYQQQLLGFFLLAAAMIFYQSLPFFSLFLLVFAFNLLPLILLHGTKIKLKSAVAVSLKILLPSIPLCFILFFIFPKLPPLWHIPLAKGAKTGLSDEVNLGDISRLIQSDELVFRVAFNQNNQEVERLIPGKQFYWRAMVLENFNGKSWQFSQDKQDLQHAVKHDKLRISKAPRNLTNNSKLDYKIFVEASYQTWLFALKMADISDNNVLLMPDETYQYHLPITNKISYQVTSYPTITDQKQLSNRDLKVNLTLPEKSNPKLQTLGKNLKNDLQKPQAIIDAVLKNIAQKYYYTLTPPPLLSADQLDEFYFNNKAGFCVHYASSFTVIMRAAGIPARMVTGYLGGEYNDNGKFYEIRQYDAHAWTEVWLENVGWLRIDPTAAVSPDRVNLGFSQTFAENDFFFANSPLNRLALKQFPMLSELQNYIANLDYQWTKWVVSYNGTKQSQFFKTLLTQLWQYKWHILTGVILLFALLKLTLNLVRFKKRQIIHQDKPWLTQQISLLQLLAKQGLHKLPQESLSDFSDKISKQYPNLSQDIKTFINCFAQLQYQALTPDMQRELYNKLKHHHKIIKGYFQREKLKIKI